MFITGLNKFFEKHGRKTFGIFTAVIIVSFVLYFSPGFDLLTLLGQKKAPETVFANITKEEFQKAVNSSLILISLQLNAASLSDQFIQQFAYYQAPDLAIAAKIAESRGFRADDKAIFERIKQYDIFQKDGQFDKERFENFVKNTLNPYRLNNIHLEDAVRKDIAKNRLNKAVTMSSISSDNEADFEYFIYNQRFKTKLFVFKNNDFREKVKYDDNAITDFFNGRRKFYKIEPQSRILAARLKYSDYEEKLKKELSDEDLLNYYNLNKNKFKKDDTLRPFEEVKDEIVQTLANQKATEFALNEAKKLAVDIYQKTQEDKTRSIRDIFMEETANRKIKVIETDWISKDTQIINNIGKEPKLASAVAELITDQPISDAIKGQNAAYVALLIERKDEREAQLEEVKERVIQDFIDHNAANLASEAASEAALKLFKKISDKENIDDLKELDGAQIIALPLFSYNEPPQSEYSDIIDLAMKTKAGSVSEVRKTPDASIFLYVHEKLTPEKNLPEELEKNRDNYWRKRENTAWVNFINTNFPNPKQEGAKNE